MSRILPLMICLYTLRELECSLRKSLESFWSGIHSCGRCGITLWKSEYPLWCCIESFMTGREQYYEHLQPFVTSKYSVMKSQYTEWKSLFPLMTDIHTGRRYSDTLWDHSRYEWKFSSSSYTRQSEWSLSFMTGTLSWSCWIRKYWSIVSC